MNAVQRAASDSFPASSGHTGVSGSVSKTDVACVCVACNHQLEEHAEVPECLGAGCRWKAGQRAQRISTSFNAIAESQQPPGD